MKFRAKMNEALCMRQFSSIITTLSRLSKVCVLRLCSDKFYFIISEENSFPARTSAWCTLERSHFFNEYSLVGHPEQNEIFLEFSTDMLASSLSSVKGTSNSARSMKIKLTDKVSPCLTLEIELLSLQKKILRCKRATLAQNNFIAAPKIPEDPLIYKSVDTAIDENEVVKYLTEFLNSLEVLGLPPHRTFKDENYNIKVKKSYVIHHDTSALSYNVIEADPLNVMPRVGLMGLPTQMANSRICVHDVPVSLIPRREWSEYQEPALCDYDMCIEMPSLKIVRNVVDKMKKLSHTLIISASSDNELTLKVEASKVIVSTHFKDLNVEKIRGGQKSVSVQVDIRRFSNFLTCDQMQPTKVMCNILKGKLIHQYLENSNLVLNYFLVGVDD